jgi:glucan phosphorylase
MSVTFDSLINKYEQVKITNVTNGVVSYELIYKANKNLEKTIVIINRKTKVLNSITHYYKKTMKVKEMDTKEHKVAFQTIYKEYKQNCLKGEADFDEKKYIVVSNGKIKPSSNYLTYKLTILND